MQSHEKIMASWMNLVIKKGEIFSTLGINCLFGLEMFTLTAESRETGDHIQPLTLWKLQSKGRNPSPPLKSTTCHKCISCMDPVPEGSFEHGMFAVTELFVVF